MLNFKKYKRVQEAELAEVTKELVDSYCKDAACMEWHRVSISKTDLENGSPKGGDMIARNPKNHNDQWLVAKDYFKENFTIIPSDFLERLIIEKEELENKFVGLTAFLKTEIFRKIDLNNKELLLNQHRVMAQYLDILNERISLLTKKQ